MTNLLVWALCVAALLSVVAAQGGDQPPIQPGEADALRKKWSAVEVVRDLGHIKKDLAKMIELEGAGALSQDELYFYYFRMHDFDNNNKLDGQEMMAAMFHTSHHDEDDEHGKVPLVIPEQDIANYVDSVLLADKNQDGFISYPELRTSELTNQI